MQKLKKYLYALSPQDRAKFAQHCHTTFGYLKKGILAKDVFGPIICVAIEQQTNGHISRKELRPNDWHLIWPELINNVHQQALNENQNGSVRNYG